MTPMSASMIVRNEEEGIAKAITSLGKVEAMNEVVVLDTGSTDRTVSIARDLGAIVHEQPWQDDFAFHRNHCLELCSNDWVFILDGDEELVEPGDLDELLGDEQREADSIAVHVNCVGDDGRTAEMLKGIRAFDRRAVRWKYPIHNQLVGAERTALSTACLTAHYDEDIAKTTEQRLQVLLAHADDHPDDPHYPYFLGRGYRALHDFTNTQKWAEKYLGLGLAEAREAEVWLWLIEAATVEGDIRKAYALLGEATQRHPAYPDLNHLQAAFAIKQWYNTVAHPDPQYVSVPSRSAVHAHNLKAAAELLGLPIALKDNPE